MTPFEARPLIRQVLEHEGHPAFSGVSQLQLFDLVKHLATTQDFLKVHQSTLAPETVQALFGLSCMTGEPGASFVTTLEYMAGWFSDVRAEQQKDPTYEPAGFDQLLVLYRIAAERNCKAIFVVNEAMWEAAQAVPLENNV